MHMSRYLDFEDVSQGRQGRVPRLDLHLPLREVVESLDPLAQQLLLLLRQLEPVDGHVQVQVGVVEEVGGLPASEQRLGMAF